MNGTTVFLTAIGYVFLLFLDCPAGGRGRTTLFVRPLASGRLRAEPRRLLHVLDLLRLGWSRLGARAGLSADLHRPHSRHRPRSAVHRAHRQPRPRADVTTVADFVSARYGKSQPVAAVAALIALIGSAPYVALQLKAIAPTVLMVVDSFDRAPADAGHALGLVLSGGVAAARRLRDGVRHPAHQPQGASGRPHPRNRGRSRSSSSLRFSPSASSSSGASTAGSSI